MLVRKTNWSGAIIGIFIVALAQTSRSQPRLRLDLQTRGHQSELSWPTTVDVPGQGDIFPTYTVERSLDLVHWEPVTGKIKGLSDRSGPTLEVLSEHSDGLGFFRLKADLSPPDGPLLGRCQLPVPGLRREHNFPARPKFGFPSGNTLSPDRQPPTVVWGQCQDAPPNPLPRGWPLPTISFCILRACTFLLFVFFGGMSYESFVSRCPQRWAEIDDSRFV